MSQPSEMAERHGRILARLSELGLSLAEATHERALAAETPKEAAELGLAFHRISRSVRQTLALEARLEREGQRELAEMRVQAARDQADAAERRKAQVRLAVEREIWDEYEDSEEIEDLLDGLAQRLDREAVAGGFAATTSVEAHVERIRADLGLPDRDEAADSEDRGAEDIDALDALDGADPVGRSVVNGGEPGPPSHHDMDGDDYWRSSA